MISIDRTNAAPRCEAIDRECVKACVVCYQACQNSGTLSFLEGRVDDADATNRALDCAALCMTSALLIARDSKLAARAARLCSLACQRCLESVPDDSGLRWQECRRACLDVQRKCREFVESREGT